MLTDNELAGIEYLRTKKREAFWQGFWVGTVLAFVICIATIVIASLAVR